MGNWLDLAVYTVTMVTALLYEVRCSSLTYKGFSYKQCRDKCYREHGTCKQAVSTTNNTCVMEYGKCFREHGTGNMVYVN